MALKQIKLSKAAIVIPPLPVRNKPTIVGIVTLVGDLPGDPAIARSGFIV